MMFRTQGHMEQRPNQRPVFALRPQVRPQRASIVHPIGQCSIKVQGPAALELGEDLGSRVLTQAPKGHLEFLTQSSGLHREITC